MSAASRAVACRCFSLHVSAFVEDSERLRKEAERQLQLVDSILVSRVRWEEGQRSAMGRGGLGEVRCAEEECGEERRTGRKSAMGRGGLTVCVWCEQARNTVYGASPLKSLGGEGGGRGG
eukprot:3041356-Rhodomonas_salina.1